MGVVVGQLHSALVALLFGALLGVVLFVPFVAIRYRRDGRLTLGRTLLWASSLVYGFALWTYTLLPLPEPSTIRCVSPQLRPFQFVSDILDYPTGSLGELVRNPAVMQAVLNIALFLPLGFLLRVPWNRGVIVATIAGFGVSLAIETTQLTGVWGIFPCAYRLFDVDDLIMNTLGAVVGSLVALAFRGLLRRRRATAPSAPRRVTLARRVLGAICDVLAVVVLGAGAGIAVNLWRLHVLGVPPETFDQGPADVAAALVPLVTIGLIVLLTGRTVGDHATLLRWDGGVRPLLLSRLFRYLGGIGGWQVLGFVGFGLDFVFLITTVIALIATRDRGGLPGIVSRAHLVDARTPQSQSSRRTAPTIASGP